MELELNVRPVVLIYLDNRSSTEDIQFVLYGMEEEKIPYSLEQKNFSTATEAAYVAANTSMKSFFIIKIWHQKLLINRFNEL